MLQSTTAIIADADEIRLDGFVHLLQTEFQMQVMGTTGNAAGLQQQLPKQPQFILIDAQLPAPTLQPFAAKYWLPTPTPI